MKERDILRFEGPLGTFFMREESAKPIVFVASGTGFAPIESIIEHALHKGVARPMLLYWGGRGPVRPDTDGVPPGSGAGARGVCSTPVRPRRLPRGRRGGR